MITTAQHYQPYLEESIIQREYYQWVSPYLNRNMEMLVFGHAGARVLVFPARMGRFYDYEDWGLVNALRPQLENGLLQLFCVDSVDTESLYCGWRTPRQRLERHIQYEKYIMNEVLPFTRRKNSDPCMIAHGCSLGAYHAVNIAFRYPENFGKVVALSGRYDLTVPVAEFTSLFDDYYDADIYFHTPSHYLPNLEDKNLLRLLRRMEIITVNGQEDPFLENNRHLSNVLWEKGIENTFHVWEGRAHCAKYWRKMVPMYL